MLVHHYIYGKHPQEREFELIAYSDEIDKKFYEEHFVKLIHSIPYSDLKEIGEARILSTLEKNREKKVVLSFVNPKGRDSFLREGVYSHNIVVDLQDYIKIPLGTIEKYFKDIIVFRWNHVPGEDSGRFKKFLKDELGISWAENAGIEKTDDDKTITAFLGKNSIKIAFNGKERLEGGEGTKVTIETDDGKTYDRDLLGIEDKFGLNVYNIKLKGLLQMLQIDTDVVIEYNKIEKFIKFKDTLKNILSTMLSSEKLKLVCKNRDASTLIKIPILLLEFLPKKNRAVPYITTQPHKNENNFKLILRTSEPSPSLIYEENWKIFDIDEEAKFEQGNNIQKVAGYIVDRYYEGRYKALEEFHSFWEKRERETRCKDIEDCARMFVSTVVLEKCSIEELLNIAKEDFRKGNLLDSKSAAQNVIMRIEEVPEPTRYGVFSSASEIILGVADKEPKGFDASIEEIMAGANSIFSKEEQSEIIMSISEKFPNRGDEISPYLRKVDMGEILRFLQKSNILPPNFNAEEIIKHKDFADLQLSIQTNILYKYFDGVDPTKIINDLEADDPASTPIYKALDIIYRNSDKLRDSENRKKIKVIIEKIIDGFDRTIEKSLFRPPKLGQGISLSAFSKLVSSDITILLLCLLEDFDLKDHTKTLKKIMVKSIDFMFDPETVKRLKLLEPVPNLISNLK